mmetsp:Transcript_20529/g.55243  ORF Transcript_20529/g.55243 Transcript_20529/m.55243 type:complete len:399 (-) Transcript_20529:598-1794(-)
MAALGNELSPSCGGWASPVRWLRQAPVASSPAAGACASPSPPPSCPSQTCCCSTSPPTTWTCAACSGSRTTSPMEALQGPARSASGRARLCSSSHTTATSSRRWRQTWSSSSDRRSPTSTVASPTTSAMRRRRRRAWRVLWTRVHGRKERLERRRQACSARRSATPRAGARTASCARPSRSSTKSSALASTATTARPSSSTHSRHWTRRPFACLHEWTPQRRQRLSRQRDRTLSTSRTPTCPPCGPSQPATMCSSASTTWTWRTAARIPHPRPPSARPGRCWRESSCSLQRERAWQWWGTTAWARARSCASCAANSTPRAGRCARARGSVSPSRLSTMRRPSQPTRTSQRQRCWLSASPAPSSRRGRGSASLDSRAPPRCSPSPPSPGDRRCASVSPH